jgi:hypothetical protein
MATMLYWIVYHFDLGRFGRKVLQLAVRSWLKRERKNPRMPLVRRQNFGGLTILRLEPKFGDERM